MFNRFFWGQIIRNENFYYTQTHTHTHIYIYIKVYEFIDLNNFSKNKSRSSYKHFSWLIFKQMMKQDNNK